MENNKSIYKCLCCDNYIDYYEPKYCCDGFQCGCLGLPIEPPLCEKCEKNFWSHLN